MVQTVYKIHTLPYIAKFLFLDCPKHVILSLFRLRFFTISAAKILLVGPLIWMAMLLVEALL